MRRIILFLFFIGVSASTLHAQEPVPLLERKLTISFSNEKTDEALKRIATAGGFNFSYNPSLFNTETTFTGSFRNAPVRQILDHIFEGEIEYRERSRHIILVKAKPALKKKR